MGKHNKSHAPLVAASIGGTAAGLTAFMLAATPAFAAGSCGVIPGHSEVLHHDAVTHQVTHTTPGQPEISYDLSRWSKDVPATPAVTQQQVQVDREIPGTPAVTHQENQYDRVVPGTSAVTQQQVQVDRQVPGTPAVTHTEYQFSKTETVTVPPEGYPTIPNPDYKPAWDETVTVTAAYTDYMKWNWTAPEKDDVAPDGPPPGAGWHQVGVTNDSKGNTPDKVIHQGNGNGSYFYFQSQHHDAVTKVVHHDAVGTPTIPNPDYKPGSTKDVTVYRTADGGTTTDLSQAAWFTQSSFSGWTQFDTRTVTDTPATPGHTVYRAQDGSTTTNSGDAGWFPVNQLPALQSDGWAQFGDAKTVVVTPATPDVTYYLVVSGATHVEYKYVYHFSEGGHTVTLYYDGTPDGTDNEADAIWVNPAVTTVNPRWTPFENRTVTDPGTTFTESTNKADASWIPAKTSVDPKWSVLDTRTVTDTPATPGHTVYRAQDGSTTTNSGDAGWFPVNQLPALQSDGWAQFGDAKTVVVTPAKAGYTEYYVPGGAPSTTLTDANWTKDSPKDWTLVDKKHVVVKIAVPPVTTHSTVTDKAAWNETVTTPAKDKTCAAGTTGNNGGTPNAKTGLAETGFDDTPWIALGGLALAGGVVITLVARRRREDGDEA